MRIWDLPLNKLCDRHLLGEHRELHAIWNIITQNKTGYSKHPETLRWIGKLKALYVRHEAQVAEMTRRGFNHKTPLDKKSATGKAKHDGFVDSVAAQKRNIAAKKCKCRI